MYHLAQINIATLLAPIDDPLIADFVAQLDRVNALADSSDGFVWRLQADVRDGPGIAPTGDPLLIVNMSVWRDVESLFTFVYRTSHREVMLRRREWFVRPRGAYQALWWVKAGHLPDTEEGFARLRMLDCDGSTPAAFTFKSVFPPTAIQSGPVDQAPEPYCVGWP